MPVTHGVASSSLVRTATREAEKLPFLVSNQQITKVLRSCEASFPVFKLQKKSPLVGYCRRLLGQIHFIAAILFSGLVLHAKIVLQHGQGCF